MVLVEEADDLCLKQSGLVSRHPAGFRNSCAALKNTLPGLFFVERPH